MTEANLADVPLRRLAGQAQLLARQKQITGEAALALIIWPDPVHMRNFVEQVRKDRAGWNAGLDALSLARAIADPNRPVPFRARLHHAHRKPVPGMCRGYVKLGETFERNFGRVRCSRRASIGDYCRTHAKEEALAA